MSEKESSKRVLHSLAKIAKESSLSINELRIVLALERIVARIEAHKTLREKLIFKGGFVLLKSFDSQRFTRDLDALASEIPKTKLLSQVKAALSIDLYDGLYFLEPEIDDLKDQGQYGGYRLKIRFQIGPLPKESHKLKKLSCVHLDIGFGDRILGKPKRTKLQSVIENEKPISWRVYPIESIYAEKLETLVSRASANSRAKDLYDLITLFNEINSPTRLKKAINTTFSNRGTDVPESFSEYFRSLDLTVLEHAWGSVQLSNSKMTFSDCKEELQTVLAKIDVRLAKKK